MGSKPATSGRTPNQSLTMLELSYATDLSDHGISHSFSALLVNMSIVVSVFALCEFK